MASSEAKGQPNIRHPNAPSARLATEQADNSGTVNTDRQFMADRLASLNQIGAHSYLIDEGSWEKWFGLFADDFEFVSTTPMLETVTIRGQNAFREFVVNRYVKGGKASPAVRRHAAENLHAAHQSATTANVRAYIRNSVGIRILARGCRAQHGRGPAQRPCHAEKPPVRHACELPNPDFQGQMTLAFTEMQVLEDLPKK